MTLVIKMAATAVNATLAYDSEGRLRQSVIAAATVNLTYDGSDLVAEYDAANVLQRRYVHGPGVDEPLVVYEGATTTAKSWLYKDHLGSVIGTADATGTSTAIYSYGPYGEPNTTSGQRFRYTGQQLIGGLGLYYYKARFYSPALGRFLQTDPIGYADDLNLYAYVGGNPVNLTDPSGLVANWAKGMTLTDVPGVGWLSPNQAASSADYWSNLRTETGNPLYAVPQGIATLWAENSDAVIGVLSSVRGLAGGTRAGKSFTQKGKAEIDAENAARNGGTNVCETCGIRVVPGQQSQSGVAPPGNERQRDHIIPKSKGGDGDPTNGQILCRGCNLIKSDR